MPLRLYSLLLLFLCFAASSAAQENYTFTHLNTDDGLSSNDVRCLYQDYKGFMWIGTANGLQRFDGGRRVDVAHGHVARGGRRERGGFPRASGGGGHAVRLIRGCCLVTRIR